MVDSPSRNDRRKKNKAHRQELAMRKVQADRRRRGLNPDEEETVLASYARRLLALLFDQLILICFALVWLVGLVVILGKGDFPPYLTYAPQMIFGIAYVVPRISSRGQTYGCRKTGITIIREDGQGYLTYKESFMRWFISFGIPNLVVMALAYVVNTHQIFLSGLSTLISVLIIAPAFRTDKRQGLHDMATHALVVRQWKVQYSRLTRMVEKRLNEGKK